MLNSVEAAPHTQQRRSCSLFAVSHKGVYVLAISRDKYRKALELCKNRIKIEKFDFLRSVELISMFQRNSLKNLTKFLVRRSLNRQ